MKKNAIQIFWAVIISCLPHIIFSQTISSTVKNTYHPSIVAQVFDLTVKANLSETSQESLAALIKDRDDQMHGMLMNGKTIKEVNDVKLDYNDQINFLLNVEQKFEIYSETAKETAKDKFSYSQFAIAIRFKDSLALTSAQTSSIYLYIDSLKQKKNQHYKIAKKSLDTRAYESTHISQILTNTQYDKLLYYKNLDKAKAFAESDWLELKQRGLDSAYVQTKVIEDLTTYYAGRECTYNKFQHDLIQQKAEVRNIYFNRPPVLRVLERARRNPENNTQNKSYNWGGN